MEVEGFSEIAGIIRIAKELHDAGRRDIIQAQFCDYLCYDCWFEDMLGVISTVFSGFYSNYDDGDDEELMIFTDDIISDYFCYAWEFSKKTNIHFDKNPYVADAEREVRRWLSFTYNLDWSLLGYTKTKRAARKSKLIVGTSCEFGEHDDFAYGLIQLYKWFSDKCAEFRKQTKTITEEVMAA